MIVRVAFHLKTARVRCMSGFKLNEFGIKISQSDDRVYRSVVLANGLTAILVSDVEADQAAACMTVGVGHLCDPVSTLLRTGCGVLG